MPRIGVPSRAVARLAAIGAPGSRIGRRPAAKHLPQDAAQAAARCRATQRPAEAAAQTATQTATHSGAGRATATAAQQFTQQPAAGGTAGPAALTHPAFAGAARLLLHHRSDALGKHHACGDPGE